MVGHVLPIVHPVLKVAVKDEAVYPVANRDDDAKQRNNVHGQTHSHLEKEKFNKIRWVFENVMRDWGWLSKTLKLEHQNHNIPTIFLDGCISV